MLDFWLKVAGVVVAAGILGGAGTIVKHEVQVSVVENDIQYIRQSQERIEHKLDEFLGEK
jgi:hypothetical protein